MWYRHTEAEHSHSVYFRSLYLKICKDSPRCLHLKTENHKAGCLHSIWKDSIRFCNRPLKKASLALVALCGHHHHWVHDRVLFLPRFETVQRRWCQRRILNTLTAPHSCLLWWDGEEPSDVIHDVPFWFRRPAYSPGTEMLTKNWLAKLNNSIALKKKKRNKSKVTRDNCFLYTRAPIPHYIILIYKDILSERREVATSRTLVIITWKRQILCLWRSFLLVLAEQWLTARTDQLLPAENKRSAFKWRYNIPKSTVSRTQMLSVS